jgi:chloramphenicol 3-O phosphotransferase
MSLVILLNGTSSAGKSSIAQALQTRYDGLLLHQSVDDWFSQLPPQHFTGEVPLTPAQSRALFRAFHWAVAATANAGIDVAVDMLLLEPEWLADLRESLVGHRVCFVGVHCPLEELERREAERGDRELGLARAQLNTVHSHSPYDVEVDTSAALPGACAERILSHLADASPTTVFWPSSATGNPR